MTVQKRGRPTNGKPFGFDTEADFIPFEFSEDEEDEVSVSRKPESRTSVVPTDSISSTLKRPRSPTNEDGRKRKRKHVESSPETAPPAQRQKVTNVIVNPWQNDINAYASYKETAKILHREIRDFSDWISPTSKEDEVRAYVVKRVVDSIESRFPRCRASPFGSFNTKLYVPDADIDMVVEWPGHTWTKESMRQLGRHIEKSGIGRSLQYIFSAKVPIIKFVDTFARIDIDLAFNQFNALQVVALVQQYLHDMPAVRPLVMVLKTLFRQSDLSVPAEGGLGSYSIICMVISFLQRHPKIAAGHIRAEDNLGAMLIEILELYGLRFNFDRVGIAIDNGGSYFDKLSCQSENQHIWKRICVRDPNDPSNNIAKASHQNDNIIKVFSDAFRELTTRCYIIHARIKNGEAAPWGTNCGSILDSIIERPQVPVRERLIRVWEEKLAGLVALDRLPADEEKGNLSSHNVTNPNMPDLRATKGTTKERKLNIQRFDNDKPEIVFSPSKHPTKRRTPTPAVSGETKDTPILLNSSPDISSPRFTSRQSPSPGKKNIPPSKFADQAAANLQATGSISGASRNIISID